jgi:hypothetical protein
MATKQKPRLVKEIADNGIVEVLRKLGERATICEKAFVVLFFRGHCDSGDIGKVFRDELLPKFIAETDQTAMELLGGADIDPAEMPEVALLAKMIHGLEDSYYPDGVAMDTETGKPRIRKAV